MTTRRVKRGRPAAALGHDAPPFPATAWADEADFAAFWGQTPAEMEAEDQATSPEPRVSLADGDEMIAYLRALQQRRADV